MAELEIMDEIDNYVETSADLGKELNDFIAQYSKSDRQCAAAQMFPTTRIAEYGWIRKYFTGGSSMCSDTLKQFADKLYKSNHIGYICAFVVTDSKGKSAKQVQPSSVLASAYDKLVNISVAGANEPPECVTKPVKITLELDGHVETHDVKNGGPNVLKSDLLEIKEFNAVRAYTADLIVAHFRYEEGVLKNFDEQHWKRVRPYITSRKFTDFRILVQGAWSLVWMKHGDKKTVEPSGSGAYFAQVIYQTFSENVCAGIWDAFRKTNFYPVDDFVPVKGTKTTVPMLRTQLSWCVYNDLPDGAVIKVAKKDKKILRIKNFTADAAQHFLYTSRGFRGVDGKHYSGYTRGYFYGLKYMPSGLITSANWQNIVLNCEIKSITAVIVVARNIFDAQGVCSAVSIKIPTVPVYILGVNNKKEEYCHKFVTVFKGDTNTLLNSKTVEGVGKEMKKTNISVFDRSKTLIIHTEMESIYESFSSRNKALGEREEAHLSKWESYQDMGPTIRMLPITKYTEHILTEKKLELVSLAGAS